MSAAPAAAPSTLGRVGRYARALTVPVLLWALVVIGLREPVGTWLHGEDGYDQAALQEWLLEARGFRETLPEMVESFLASTRDLDRLQREPIPDDPAAASDLLARQVQAQQAVAVKREEIHEQLQSLGDPPTKMYAGQLPLFPVIYRLEVRFEDEPDAPIVWDSGLPSRFTRHQELELRLNTRAGEPGRASVWVRYQLHASSKRQRIEQDHARRLWQLGVLALAATTLGVVWLIAVRRREQRRARQRVLADMQVAKAEQLRVEAERALLEQRLATQAAERHALELKSQLYAGIGIMAGSYAHNIKNLLVRPNDLLRRCLEADGLSGDQETMLEEVRQTLGTVTERLQQILRTVRRDPTRIEQTLLDLNGVLRDLDRTWHGLAREKWKLEMNLDLDAEALPVAGDASHLQQAVENLLFNARDATFEMRNHLRDDARRSAGAAPARKEALIAAAGWKGRVTLRTRREGDRAVLEVRDNGAGMTDEVRRRCTETYFTTKRDNALYEGHSTGMGLGLSFVVTILEHYHAALEIESAPLEGTTFQVRFPLADGSPRTVVRELERK
jgi:signal transduction histidine kinase